MNDIIEYIKSQIDTNPHCSMGTKETRARRGAYIDILTKIEENKCDHLYVPLGNESIDSQSQTFVCSKCGNKI